MEQVYIPSLDVFAGFITNPNEKAAFILRHLIYNPSKVSDYFDEEQLSLRELAYAYQNDPDLLAATVKTQLSTAIARNIPELFTDVDVTYKNISDEKYKLVFNITGTPIENGSKISLILNGSFHIDEDYRITIDFTE